MASRRKRVLVGLLVAVLLACGIGAFVARRALSAYPALTLPTDSVWALAFDPTGTRLAGAGYYGDVTVWRMHDGRVQQTFPTGLALSGAALRVQLAFSPDGQLLAQSGPNGVRLWDVSSGQTIPLVEAPQTAVGAMAFLDAQHVQAWTRAGELLLWAIPSGRLVSRQPLLIAGVQGARFSPDGQSLLTCRGDSTSLQGQLEMWRLRDGALQQSVATSGSSIECTVTPTADGASAVVHFQSAEYSIVDLHRSVVRHILRSLQGFEAGAATFNARGTWVALGNSNSVSMWQMASGRSFATLRIGLPLPFVPSVRIFSIAVSADERLVAAGCNDGYIRIWRR